MPSAPLLSILIPTRNRPHTAVAAARTALLLPPDEIEVVVQDCSDTDALGARLGSEIGDPRVRYHYTPPPVAMTENFNRAIAAATGEYICLIGDDDGVHSSILDGVRWAYASDMDALMPDPRTTYYWPDFRSRFSGDAYAGKLIIAPYTNQVRVSTDLMSSLERAAEVGGRVLYDLPRLYQSIVRRRCLETLREHTGVYLKGTAPDFYAAFALADIVTKVCHVDHPFVLLGSSGVSNSGRIAARKFDRNMASNEHGQEYGEMDWPDVLPPTFTVRTVVAESALLALQTKRWNDLEARFGLDSVYAGAAIEDGRVGWMLRQYVAQCRRHRKSALGGTARFATRFAQILWNTAAPRVASRLHRDRNHSVTLPNLEDSVAAALALADYIKRSGRRFCPPEGS